MQEHHKDSLEITTFEDHRGSEDRIDAKKNPILRKIQGGTHAFEKNIAENCLADGSYVKAAFHHA
jgi:hypothetical protein